MQRIRVFLVDAQPVFRMGLRALLNREPDMVVVGEAADGTSACFVLPELQPDIVLTEPPPPEGSGLEPSHASLSLSPISKVVILAAQRSSTSAFAMFKHGARGYLVKQSMASEIVHAVRQVAGGGAVLDPLVAADLLTELQQLWRKPPVTPLVHLSERETRILSLVAQGYSNREIGNRLNLAEKTIRNALRELFQKHNFASRAQAAAFAVQVGLLDGMADVER